MEIAVRDNASLVEDLESKIREGLENGLPINWKLFCEIAYNKHLYGDSVHKQIVDLFLRFEILDVNPNGNIILRYPDATSFQHAGNPRYYRNIDAENGNNLLFFRRDLDALDYMKAAEESNCLVKGYQAQRIFVVK